MKNRNELERLVKTLEQAPFVHGLIIKFPKDVSRRGFVEPVLEKLGLTYLLAEVHDGPFVLRDIFQKCLGQPWFVVLGAQSNPFQGSSLEVFKAALTLCDEIVDTRFAKWPVANDGASTRPILFDGKLIILTDEMPETLAMRELIKLCFIWSVDSVDSDCKGIAEFYRLLTLLDKDKKEIPDPSQVLLH